MPRKGENIYKRKDGRWEGRYIKQKISGSIKYGYVYGKSYSEVKKKLEYEKVKFYQTVKYLNNTISDIKFREIADLWLNDKRVSLKESSYVRYKNIMTVYIIPRLGDKTLSSIDYTVVSALISELLAYGGAKGTGLASKMVFDILAVIKMVLRYASQRKYTVDMSAMNVSVKQKNPPVKTLGIADYCKLIKYLQSDLTSLNLGILICAFTGIRLGELCALTWNDFAFEKKILHVHKTMQRLQISEGDTKTKIQITEPKSQCSIRDIPIPEILMPYLDNNGLTTEYVLSGHSDCYVEPRTLQNYFKRILKQCGIEDVNFHVLRHTFATRCVELGFDVKSLSEILGHANVNITLNRYVHPSMDLKQQNMSKLSDLFTVK